MTLRGHPTDRRCMQTEHCILLRGRAQEAEALAALTTVCGGLSGCTLRSLDLSDNALGEKGVRAVAAALRSQPALQVPPSCHQLHAPPSCHQLQAPPSCHQLHAPPSCHQLHARYFSTTLFSASLPHVDRGQEKLLVSTVMGFRRYQVEPFTPA